MSAALDDMAMEAAVVAVIWEGGGDTLERALQLFELAERVRGAFARQWSPS